VVELFESHHCSQYKGEAKQAERQADGQLGDRTHGAIATVGWTSGTKLRLLTDAVTTD